MVLNLSSTSRNHFHTRLHTEVEHVKQLCAQADFTWTNGIYSTIVGYRNARSQHLEVWTGHSKNYALHNSVHTRKGNKTISTSSMRSAPHAVYRKQLWHAQEQTWHTAERPAAVLRFSHHTSPQALSPCRQRTRFIVASWHVLFYRSTVYRIKSQMFEGLCIQRAWTKLLMIQVILCDTTFCTRSATMPPQSTTSDDIEAM
eukprot:4870081-Amphidinium_carterae.1